MTGRQSLSPGAASLPARRRGAGSAVPSQGGVEHCVSLSLDFSICNTGELLTMPHLPLRVKWNRRGAFRKGWQCGRDTYEPGPESLPGMALQ